MKKPKTIEEAATNLLTVAKFYFERMGWKDIPIEKLGQGDESCLMINGWITINPFATKEHLHCMFDKRTVDAIHYSMTKEICQRSFSRDEPDDIDIVDVEDCQDMCSFIEAIEKAIYLMIFNDLSAIGEQYGEECLEKEVEKK